MFYESSIHMYVYVCDMCSYQTTYLHKYVPILRNLLCLGLNFCWAFKLRRWHIVPYVNTFMSLHWLCIGYIWGFASKNVMCNICPWNRNWALKLFVVGNSHAFCIWYILAFASKHIMCRNFACNRSWASKFFAGGWGSEATPIYTHMHICTCAWATHTQTESWRRQRNLNFSLNCVIYSWKWLQTNVNA